MTERTGYSLDQVTAFLLGVWLFAHWKDGIQYVGTSGTTYAEVAREPGKYMKIAGVKVNVEPPF